MGPAPTRASHADPVAGVSSLSQHQRHPALLFVSAAGDLAEAPPQPKTKALPEHPRVGAVCPRAHDVRVDALLQSCLTVDASEMRETRMETRHLPARGTHGTVTESDRVRVSLHSGSHYCHS